MIDTMDRSILKPEIQYKLLCSKKASTMVKMEDVGCQQLLAANGKLGWAYSTDMFTNILLFFIHVGITIYYGFGWMVGIGGLFLIILGIAFSGKNSRPWHYIFIIGIPLVFQHYLSLVFAIQYIVTHLLFLFIYKKTLDEFIKDEEIFLIAVNAGIISIYPDSNIDVQELDEYIKNID